MNGFGDGGVGDLVSQRIAEKREAGRQAAAPYLADASFTVMERGRAGAVLTRFGSALDATTRAKLTAVAHGGQGVRLRAQADKLEAQAQALRDRAGPAGPSFGDGAA